jgi:ketosteroid isomerase-like protein
MKTILAMVLLATAVAHAQNAKPSNDEKALLGVNEAWAAAEQKQDAATLDRLLDDGFISVSSGGKIQNKADFLSDILQTKLTSYQITEETAHLYGPTGIVTCKYQAHWMEGAEEEQASLQILAVYTKRDGQWRAVGGQFSRLPKQ